MSILIPGAIKTHEDRILRLFFLTPVATAQHWAYLSFLNNYWVPLQNEQLLMASA
jgi:hypothetical protein